MIIILLIITIYAFINYVFRRNFKETFNNFFSSCPTRNMSYDLRGEAHFPPRTNFPFNNSEIGPNNQRCYPKRIILNEKNN